MIKTQPLVSLIGQLNKPNTAIFSLKWVYQRAHLNFFLKLQKFGFVLEVLHNTSDGYGIALIKRSAYKRVVVFAPQLRAYYSARSLRQIRGRFILISTSKGLLTNTEALVNGIGGQLILEIIL